MPHDAKTIEDLSEHCCHGAECECHSLKYNDAALSEAHLSALIDMAQYSCLPISRFVMSGKEDDICFSALAPVFINDPDDSMETVKEIGTTLTYLEQNGLITLDYDIPIRGYDYKQYTDSALYAYFKQTVKAGSEKSDFLFDTAKIELGSMALTEAGHKVLSQLKE